MWLFAGAVALIAALVNLALVAAGKPRYCCALVCVSLSGGLLAMLSQYRLVSGWVAAQDMSALADVVPTMTGVLTAAVCIGILLNAVAVCASYKQKKP